MSSFCSNLIPENVIESHHPFLDSPKDDYDEEDWGAIPDPTLKLAKLEIEVEQLRVQFARYRSALIGLIGVETKEELEAMEIALRLLPVPEKDRTITINAIHALLGI